MNDEKQPPPEQPPPSHAQSSWRPAISSMSLGRGDAGHALERRLDLARDHGYSGISLFFDDIERVAHTLHAEATAGRANNGRASRASVSMMRCSYVSARGSQVQPLPFASWLLQAAALIGDMCAQRQLAVVCLQPFRNYEGLRDNASRQARLDELRLWCGLAGNLDTDLILVPSNFLPAAELSTRVPADLVADLRIAAAVAADAYPPIRLCYEALAWGTHVSTWEQSWELVRQANCANLGVCLDTFQLAAQLCGGTVPGPSVSAAATEVVPSLERLVSTVPKEKVFLVQVADAEALAAPLLPGHPLYDADQPACMTWSHNCRLFYGETDRGGSLPIQTIAWYLLCQLGYRGFVSMEVFHRRLAEPDAGIPGEMAARGAASWAKLLQDLSRRRAQAASGAKTKQRRCSCWPSWRQAWSAWRRDDKHDIAV